MTRREKYISLVTRKNGSQSFYILIRMNGQTFRKNINISEFPTKAAALDAAVLIRDEKIVELRSEKLQIRKDTLKEIYKKSYELIPVRYQTRQRHDIYFRHVLKPFEDTPLADITSADIQLTVNQYAETHTKYETGKMLAVWRRLYKTAAMMELNVPDKTAAVVLPEGVPGKKRNVELSLQDFNTFLDCLLNYNIASISGAYDAKAVRYALLVMLYCGLRPAETYALSRNDIDMVNGLIRINAAIGSDKKQYPVIASTKTEQSVRSVPIPKELKPVLEEALKWSKHEIIFSRYFGQLLTSSWVDTLKRNIIQTNKLNIDFRLYQLRHLFSTDLHRCGTNPAVIRDLMGHESASMSLDYAVSSPEERRKAVDQLRNDPVKEEKNTE